MLQQSGQQRTSSIVFDNNSQYGWASILLHWITAIAVVALWIIGKSILNGPAEETNATRQLHISFASSVWLFILFRVAWRFRVGHPRVSGLSDLDHRTAKTAHYVMLIALLLMLVSGPFLVWSGGDSISIFNWFEIPAPIQESDYVRSVAWFIHSNSALLLLFLVLMHIGGAFKHLMFHSDDVFARMIWPKKRDVLELK